MAAKKKPQAKKDTEGNVLLAILGIAFVIWVIASAVMLYETPEHATEEEASRAQPHIDAIRKILREAENTDVASTGPWDDHVAARFSGLVLILQKDPVWGNPTGKRRDTKTGWNQVPDGIWTTTYSEHLQEVAKAAPSGAKKDAILRLRAAAEALDDANVLWTPGIAAACAVSFWNGFLSGWADDAVIAYRFESETKRRRARRDFKKLLELGNDYAPYRMAILMIAGAIFSLGTLVGGFFLVRFAPTPGAAFKGAFCVEMGEAIAFMVGNWWTIGVWSDGWLLELGFGAAAGIVIGGWEAGKVSKRLAKRST